jgi:DnaJ-class molecular chaperone
MLSVPKGSPSGKVLRLKGKGFHTKDGTKDRARGDQLVTLMIDIPPTDSELEAFVEGWSRRGKGNPRVALGV